MSAKVAIWIVIIRFFEYVYLFASKIVIYNFLLTSLFLIVQFLNELGYVSFNLEGLSTN